MHKANSLNQAVDLEWLFSRHLLTIQVTSIYGRDTLFMSYRQPWFGRRALKGQNIPQIPKAGGVDANVHFTLLCPIIFGLEGRE